MKFLNANLLSLLLAIGIFVPGAASGEESDVLYVRPVKEGIHNRMAGSRIGELFRGTRVRKISEEGDWVKVSLEFWMRKEKVVALQRSGIKPDGQVFDDVLVVKSFEVKVPDPGAKGQKAAFALLNVENKLNRRINGFRAVLIIKKGEKVVHREPINYDLEPIEAKSEGSVIFSWASSDPVFDIITEDTGEKLEIKLGKVTLR